MSISVGQKFPDATLTRMGDKGPETVELAPMLKGRKVVIFGFPGAYTGTCSTAHLPSFIRTAEDFQDKGVAEIIGISVNDPFALGAWDAEIGAGAAGITLLGDSSGALTEALGMAFTAPPIGLYGRSNRYAVVVEDGTVTVAMIDEPGVCDVSRGEQLLEAM